MSVPINKALYEKAKATIYPLYKKPSAYRSGAVVKKYKELGGKYTSVSKDRPLERWFKESWKDVNPSKSKSSYPVYRPTKRINKKTPLTLSEIDKKDLIKQSKIKQVIKGKNNLKKFKKK